MKANKVLSAVAILSIGLLLSGCEEEHHHGHRPPPDHRHPEHHRHHHEHRGTSRGEYHTHYHHWRGRYHAVAMNDISCKEGTEVNLEVLEVNGELYLLDPLDRMFRFHVEGEDVAKVAGGYLKKENNGQYIYKDVRGGIWLVEKE